MTSALHSLQTANHKIESWTYANAAARTGATGFTSNDLGKVAYQSDTGEYWRLMATTPTWAAVVVGMAGGVLTVPGGGTGVATLATNGVLYGNGAGVVQVTAQGAANTILIANAGAPSFSATPTIGTSLGIGGAASANYVFEASGASAAAGNLLAGVVNTTLTGSTWIVLGQAVNSQYAWLKRYNTSHATLPGQMEIALFDNAAMRFLTNNTLQMTLSATGQLGVGVVPTANLHVKAGTATANTAPLKFTSGTLLTTPEAGAIEFLTDAFYGTITTGAARKTFAFLESPSFTTPTLGVASATSLTVPTINTIRVRALVTTAVKTTATSILTISNTTLALVQGQDGDDYSRNFGDLVIADLSNLTVTVVAAASAGGAHARTYTVSGSDVKVAFAAYGGTIGYTVRVQGFGG